MKATLEQIRQIENIYKESGLNAVNYYIKRQGIEAERNVYEFGFGKKASQEKFDFLNSEKKKRVLRFHYYSISKKCRKNGMSFNLIRAIEFVF